MKIYKIAVRNFRSYVSDNEGPSIEIDVGDGLNLFVGTNNCGKSNLLRAVALALGDWEGTGYDQQKDRPAQIQAKKHPHSIITLMFKLNPDQQVEHTLLDYLNEYERTLSPKHTYASQKEACLRVAYTPNRTVTFMVCGKGNAPGERRYLDKCIRQFRKCLRFVYLKSGEGLGDFMKEALHEVLETVLKEHLKENFHAAEGARNAFISMLGNGLLQEMGNHLKSELQKVVQEIGLVGIEPRVPMLNDMLSTADIRLNDTADTVLLDKGTGIRGVLLVAFLRYLCEHSHRSMVLAIEEPESFLHPEAQMGVRSSLEELAMRDDIVVLATTHSPLMLSRRPEARISALKKNRAGETLIEKTIYGNESHAPVITSLYGSSLIPYILESIHPIEDAGHRILFVEGETDKTYIEHAANVSGKEYLLDGFEIRASQGCHKMVLDALLMRQLTGNAAHILVLFDDDEMGKSAAKTIKRYNFGSREIIYYRDFMQDKASTCVESEDMFPQNILESFVVRFGEENVLEEKQRIGNNCFHYGFQKTAKKDFCEFVLQEVKAKHVSKWLELIREVRSRFCLT